MVRDDVITIISPREFVDICANWSSGCYLYLLYLIPLVSTDDTTATAQLAVTEVATRSESSAEPTFAHASVAGAYKDEQYSMVHCSLTPQPNTGETHAVCK